MTTETENTDDGQSFAEFEAETLRGESTEAEQPEGELELSEEDELVEGDEEAGEDDKKPRHKSAKQRIAELTREKHEERRLRVELEQRIAALEGRSTPKKEETGEFVFDEPEPDPNDEKYEFGEADAQYIKDLARYEGRKAYAEEKHKADQESAVTRQQEATRETLVNLDNEWTAAEARGAEKYDDFAEKVEDFKANAPCPPLMAVAIQASPVAEDVTYHLATNQDQAELIAAELAGGDLLGAAKHLGEIEGQFMDTKPERPASDAHPADHALYAGRLKGFLNRKSVDKPEPKRMTSAPEPVRHTVRGGGGKYSVDDDTEDFAAFEKKVMGGR